MKTYLVTGGAGFIGSHVVRRLVSQGSCVHIFVTAHESLWRLGDCSNKVIVHHIDLRDLEKVKQSVATIKPTTIFHLASFGGTPDQLDQKMIFDVNFWGTVNLFNACKAIGFDCFINTGSSSEYGIKHDPMREDDVLEPVSNYAVAKAASTQFCLREALAEKLPVYTIRPFSVYGPYEMKTRLIPTVLLGALNHKALNLSSPHCVRDFVYIDDVVDMYMMIAEKKPTAASIFNAGSGIQSSIKDVVDVMEQITQEPCPVAWGSYQQRPWEPTHWVASIERAHSILGWTPLYTLSQGLSASLQWFAQNKQLYQEEEHNVARSKTSCCNTSAR